MGGGDKCENSSMGAFCRVTVVKALTERPVSTLWPSRESLSTEVALLLRWYFRAKACRKEEASLNGSDH